MSESMYPKIFLKRWLEWLLEFQQANKSLHKNTGNTNKVCNIHFGNLGIMSHHIQRAVSQKRLQRENITSGTQICDGECVPEFMWVGLFCFCSGSQLVDQHAQTVLVERSISMANEGGGRRDRPHPLGWQDNARQLFSQLCPGKPCALCHL